MIKLIFSDMDGTLLDENGQLPVEFPAIMEELRTRGVMFAPASGRQYYSLLKTFKEYEDQFVFVSDNGTIVRHQGKELFSDIIERQKAKEIFNSVNEIDGIYNVFCGKDTVYLLKGKNPEPQMEELMKYFRSVEVVDSFDAIVDEPIKISFFTPNADAAEKIFPLFAPYYDSMQVVLASAYWVDVTNKGANKGMAVRELQKRLGLQPEECAAFGDYMNDLEMMGAVHYSYAMENAYPPLKEAARFVAPSNAEHGVMKTIQSFIDQGLC
ncbi:hypothetical protein SAMN05216582_1147 [Selenomonas ruminantium]|uniref:Hydrolase n=1 Tax=Selenomonas ruminantium TaxID=971 RepID=A0A1M6UQB7_SELRU|nr:HAD family hydrolase [Selenomonas ruminantium]SHK71378.1 hypothetical protein SAMN05216582_1147 [Selenomonas ruminantium]